MENIKPENDSKDLEQLQKRIAESLHNAINSAGISATSEQIEKVAKEHLEKDGIDISNVEIEAHPFQDTYPDDSHGSVESDEGFEITIKKDNEEIFIGKIEFNK